MPFLNLSTADQIPAPVVKQRGVTPAERRLGKLCEKSFLSLWSYPCVFKDQGRRNGGDGKELCDLLVVFGDDIVIFSDKACAFPSTGSLDLDWSRWFRNAILSSAKQIWSAERWIRKCPDRLFLDRRCSRKFPVSLPDPMQARIHRIVVAHNVAARCRDLLGGTGSLLLVSELKGKAHFEGPVPIELGSRLSHQLLSHLRSKTNYLGNVIPFAIGDIDPAKGFVHVLDDASLAAAMQSLDTAADFIGYLARKELLFRSGRMVVASGEDDLLACYLQDCNSDGEHDFLLPSSPTIGICVPEGEWATLRASRGWKARTSANRVSYLWDRLIEVFSEHIRNATSPAYPEVDLHRQEMAVRALARENRVSRRALSVAFSDFMAKPVSQGLAVRVVAPPRPGSPHYIFLTMAPTDGIEYRAARRSAMYAYCLALKLRFPDAKEAVAIGTEPGRPDRFASYDAMHCDIRRLTPQQEAEARDIRTKCGFLATPTKPFVGKVLEYPLAARSAHYRFGGAGDPLARSMRNSPCPCGSGQKFKKCCM